MAEMRDNNEEVYVGAMLVAKGHKINAFGDKRLFCDLSTTCSCERVHVCIMYCVKPKINLYVGKYLQCSHAGQWVTQKLGYLSCSNILPIISRNT